MQLTTFSDYSLRTLMYAGIRPDDLCTVEQVADAYGISRSHLTKVVNFLGNHGYLENLRGKKGGFRLAQPANRINLGQLVRLTEQNLSLVECFDRTRSLGSEGGCRIERSCALRGVLGEALQAFMQVLDSYLLSDLLEGRQRLSMDLGISTRRAPKRQSLSQKSKTAVRVRRRS